MSLKKKAFLKTITNGCRSPAFMLQYYNALPVSRIISISLELSAVFRIPQSLVALLVLILLSLDLQGISYTVDCGCV